MACFTDLYYQQLLTVDTDTLFLVLLSCPSGSRGSGSDGGPRFFFHPNKDKNNSSVGRVYEGGHACRDERSTRHRKELLQRRISSGDSNPRVRDLEPRIDRGCSSTRHTIVVHTYIQYTHTHCRGHKSALVSFGSTTTTRRT